MAEMALMRRMMLHVVGVGLALILVAGCQADNGRLVEARVASKMLAENAGKTDFILLDVRTPQEFQQGHLHGALLMDYYAADFRDRFAMLDRNATILLYCRSGNRSSSALVLATQLGFTHVLDLRGGIQAWLQAGLPVE